QQALGEPGHWIYMTVSSRFSRLRIFPGLRTDGIGLGCSTRRMLLRAQRTFWRKSGLRIALHLSPPGGCQFGTPSPRMARAQATPGSLRVAPEQQDWNSITFC